MVFHYFGSRRQGLSKSDLEKLAKLANKIDPRFDEADALAMGATCEAIRVICGDVPPLSKEVSVELLLSKS